MGRIVIALGALLLGAPGVAASDAFHLRTDEPIEWSGRVSAIAPEGHLRAEWPALVATGALRGATGVVSVHTWQVARTQVGSSDVVRSLGPPATVAYEVENATLVLRLQATGGAFVMVGEAGSVLKASALAEGEGSAARVPDAAPSGIQLPDPTTARVPNVEPGWEGGWGFAGRYRFSTGTLRGLPLGDEARLDASGDVRVKVHGGEVSFTTRQGETVEVSTGERSDGGAGGAGIQTWTRLLFEGHLASADVPLGPTWGLAAPGLAWEVDGRAHWSTADGWVELGGVRTRVDAESVGLSGAWTMDAQARDGPLANDVYEGGGTLTRATVGTDALRRAAATTAVPTLAALAALATLAGGVVLWLFYTRLTADAVLAHPTRARMLARVRATPGLHLRELHRVVGGAWGPFMFHLGILSRRGLVTVARDGRYRVVYPEQMATAAPGSRIHHPVARQVFAVVPPEGPGKTAAQIGREIGESRRLVAYHLDRLVAGGWVTLHDEDGRRTARRATRFEGTRSAVARAPAADES